MKKLYFINDEFANSRIDRWFRKTICDVPQSLLEKNIRKGNIKVNNKKPKSSYKLNKGDQISVYNINFLKDKHKKKTYKYIPSKSDIKFSSSIFIENNENFAIINKPAGIAVQSGTKSRKNILDILSSTKEFENTTPYPVHRIDKETTGILIVAKNRKYAQLFTTLFRIRKIHKEYLAIIIGQLDAKKGTFNDDLITYENNKKIVNKAITHFKVLDSNNSYSLLKLNPQTGRKHQLRKQLLIRGHPVLGDAKYNISNSKYFKKNSLMLHALNINFSISNIKYSFDAKLSNEFVNTLNEKHLKSFQ